MQHQIVQDGAYAGFPLCASEWSSQNNCSFKILLLFLKEKKTDLCELLFSESKHKTELARTVILSWLLWDTGEIFCGAYFVQFDAVKIQN